MRAAATRCHPVDVAPGDKWLSSSWPRVRRRLPDPPARVVDIGCGRAGGFVPFLLTDGYDALGVDPNAPDAPEYVRAELEEANLAPGVDVVVASTSLHHVADPARAIDRIAELLASGGVAVVIEWAWEGFDTKSAEWCFARLRPDDEEGWARRRRDEWLESGEEWPVYFRRWVQGHGLHPSEEIVRLLDERLERRELSRGPYLYADLAGTSEADEQAAIDAGLVRPGRIDYVGVLSSVSDEQQTPAARTPHPAA